MSAPVAFSAVSAIPVHYNEGFTLLAYTRASRQMQDETAQTRGALWQGYGNTQSEKHRTGTQNSCPILFRPLCVFPIVGQRVVQNFDLRRKRIFDKEKSPKTAVFGDFWSCWADSNCRPHPYQGCALPTELQQQSLCPLSKGHSGDREGT